MKKHVNLVILVIAMFLYAGCGDSMLDLDPPSDITTDTFYRNQEDIESAVNAIYATLTGSGMWDGYIFYQMYYGDIRSDATESISDNIGFEDFTSSDLQTYPLWVQSYHAILRANTVIERAQAVEMDEALKQRYIGEARFLRAFWYFFNVRVWGDVPLVQQVVTPAEAAQIGRAPKEEVYQLIIQDLKEAAASLPVSYPASDHGRATSGAASGLLGQVYLTMGNHQAAKETFEAIINSGTYRLLDSYDELWGIENEDNDEFIFAAQFKDGNLGVGSRMFNDNAPRAYNVVGTTGQRNSPTTWFMSKWQEGDLRRNWIKEATQFLNGIEVKVHFTYKYFFPLQQNLDSGLNVPILRYADVLLMYAEALNEINGGPTSQAYEIINSIRARAGLESLPEGMTKAEFALALENERLFEFAFEGKRWFDLVRTGRAIQVMNEHFEFQGIVIRISERDLLFPIPQAAIDASQGKITQNPGY